MAFVRNEDDDKGATVLGFSTPLAALTYLRGSLQPGDAIFLDAIADKFLTGPICEQLRDVRVVVSASPDVTVFADFQNTAMRIVMPP